MTLPRWQRLMRALDLPEHQSAFESICRAYRQRHRHYHTNLHINACLRHLDEFKGLADHIEEIEFALWYHDVVYQPLSTHSESRSADRAAYFLLSNGVEQQVADRVHRLIMVTRYDARPTSLDEFIMADVDMAIFGARRHEYLMFEDDLRREYWIIPSFIYRRKRAEFISRLLDRKYVYNTVLYQSLREPQARKNLTVGMCRLN